MFSVALVEPEIPPNTGNIARLCAAVRVPLHIVGPAGFRLDDRAVRRAGLDYWPEVSLQRHRDLTALEAALTGATWVITTNPLGDARDREASFFENLGELTTLLESPEAVVVQLKLPGLEAAAPVAPAEPGAGPEVIKPERKKEEE